MKSLVKAQCTSLIDRWNRTETREEKGVLLSEIMAGASMRLGLLSLATGKEPEEFVADLVAQAKMIKTGILTADVQEPV